MSALLIISRSAEAASPYKIDVTPGNARVPKGADQNVRAKLLGFSSSEATLMVRTDPQGGFERVPLGQYSTLAFWATSILFAAEHGPYWEVGLLCGMIYNWWMWRTKSLGDVMLAHAVTNLALSVYVIAGERWTFWM